MACEAPPLSLEHAILGFLDVEPLSGYDLKTRRFSATSGNFWTADQAQIYRTLERLSESGMAKARSQRQQGKPDRKVFAITEAGRNSLTDWLAHAHDLPAYRDPFLVQLMFAATLPDDLLIDVLTARRQAHQRALDAVRVSLARTAREAPRDARSSALRAMALEGEAAIHRASVDWLDDCLDCVRSGLPGSPGAAPDGQRQLFPIPEQQPKGGTR
jgi:PadR family transcriptional regulator AphA